jgi:hypothetical protein
MAKYRIGQALVLLLGSIALAACGDTAAQTLAAHTAALTASYEKQVSDKVNAERAFYESQRQNLIESLAGYRPSDTGRLPTVGQVKESIYYLSIKTNAQRDALVTADAIVTSNGDKILTPVLKYIDAGVKEERELYVALSNSEVQLDTKLAAGLRPLDEQADRLATVRSRLVSLSQPLSEWDQLQQVIDLGRGTQKLIQSKKN